MGRTKNHIKISQQLLGEIANTKPVNPNLSELENHFNKIDSKLDKIAQLVDKIPDNSIVRPDKSWLSAFGL